VSAQQTEEGKQERFCQKKLKIKNIKILKYIYIDHVVKLAKFHYFGAREGVQFVTRIYTTLRFQSFVLQNVVPRITSIS